MQTFLFLCFNAISLVLAKYSNGPLSENGDWKFWGRKPLLRVIIICSDSDKEDSCEELIRSVFIMQHYFQSSCFYWVQGQNFLFSPSKPTYRLLKKRNKLGGMIKKLCKSKNHNECNCYFVQGKKQQFT